jgi:hypothetical protein
MQTQQLSPNQFSQLEELISNPAQSMKFQMNDFIHALFTGAFMQVFSGVMWFLFGLSILMLLSVVIFKMLKK